MIGLNILRGRYEPDEIRFVRRVLKPGDSVIDQLESLVDHALVRVDHRRDRFSMLQTMSAYANELLSASGESHAVSMSHARRFVALTEELRGQMESDGLVRALERGVVEDANVRAAIDTLLAAYIWNYRRAAQDGADAPALIAEMDRQIGLLFDGVAVRS